MTAVATAPEPARQPNRRRAYTREECIALARTWERETGAPPTNTDWDPALRRKSLRNLLDRVQQHQAAIARFEHGGYPAAVTIRKHFGSWNAFINAAGWAPRTQTRPEIAAALEPPATPTLEQVRKRVGRTPTVPIAYGRAALAGVVRKVIEAEQAGDHEALHGILLDGAAQLLAWADRIHNDMPASARAAA